jgi:hypothetical protein
MRRIMPDYETEIEEAKRDRATRLARRGKFPPKKGAGRRATRRK